jgi:DHA1 family bicyclomycin/chloramphenicol resistance-like MFS transporter
MLTAMTPLGIDMYLPGLPLLARSLTASNAATQLSVGIFLIGLVLGQLVFGPLSDRIGRRRRLLAGTAASAVFGVLCAFAPSIELFLAARFLSGFCGAVGTVLARAVIADTFKGALLTRYTAYTASVVGIAPVVAPPVGGAILHFTGSWRAIFLVLAGLGVLLTGCVWLWVPEPRPVRTREVESYRQTFTAMGKLLGNRAFTGNLLALAFISAALYVYVADSAFVFEEHYGISVSLYSFVLVTNAIGLAAGSSLAGLLARRVQPAVMVRAGLAISALATVIHLAVILTVGGSVVLSWLCLAGMLLGFGMMVPSSVVIGQVLGSQRPGAAAALLGTAQFALGAVISPLGGLFGSTGPTPMAVLMFFALLCAVLSQYLLTAAPK